MYNVDPIIVQTRGYRKRHGSVAGHGYGLGLKRVGHRSPVKRFEQVETFNLMPETSPLTTHNPKPCKLFTQPALTISHEAAVAWVSPAASSPTRSELTVLGI